MGAAAPRYNGGMPDKKKREIASKHTRLFPTTYDIVSGIATEGHTSIPHVIDGWAKEHQAKKRRKV